MKPFMDVLSGTAFSSPADGMLQSGAIEARTTNGVNWTVVPNSGTGVPVTLTNRARITKVRLTNPGPLTTIDSLGFSNGMNVTALALIKAQGLLSNNRASFGRVINAGRYQSDFIITAPQTALWTSSTVPTWSADFDISGTNLRLRVKTDTSETVDFIALVYWIVWNVPGF
jgi:hypothetical protein